MQLTAKHKVATPVNWKPGDDVIILASVQRRRRQEEVPQRLEGPQALSAIVSQPEVRKPAAPDGCTSDLQTVLSAVPGPRLLLIGDEATGTAAVVDPQRDIDQYIAFAAEHGLKIKHVFLTHLHADFVAGHLELRDRVGATIYLGAARQSRVRVHSASRWRHRRIRPRPPEDPGNPRPHAGIHLHLVYDLRRQRHAPSHHAVLTGDTLFIGDVGRPDLRAALGWSANQLGSMLYDSLHKLLQLPTKPGLSRLTAQARSAAKPSAKKPSPPWASNAAPNYALQPMTKEAFIQVVTADQPDAPAYFNYDAVLNSQERPTLDQALAREMNPLHARGRSRTCKSVGAQILDTRDPDEFAAAHLAGSINIGLGGQYATWVGTVLDRKASHRHHRRPRPRKRSRHPPRPHRLRSRRRLFAGWTAQPRIPSRFTSPSPSASAPPSPPNSSPPPTAAAIDVRAPARTRTEAHRRQPKHPAQSPHRKSADPAKRPPVAGLLRRRLPLLHRRQPAATNRIQFRRGIAGGLAAWEAAKLPVVTPAPSSKPIGAYDR